LLEQRANFGAPFNTATTTAVAAPPFGALIGGATAATANVLTFSAGGADLNVIANMVQEFGTVRALSSPRLTVMQNQTAVLKVAEEQVFFDVSIEQTTEASGDNDVVKTTASSEVSTVTVGLVMTVQPSINLDTEVITLVLRPTITSVIRTKNDPAVDFQVAQIVPAPAVSITSQIPEISVQEIDSVVTMPSGGVIVMGGLMKDISTVDESGIPGLSELPWVGQAFKSKERNTEKSELVIFLRATIIRSGDVDPYDIDLYKLFGEDRRPLTF
jgi:MSHA biogenesis protein MshL